MIDYPQKSVRTRRPALIVPVIALASALAGCGGSSTRSSTDDDAADPAVSQPTLNFVSEPTTIARGGFATLTWNATGADRCDASVGWSGRKEVAGSQTVGPIDADTAFRLSCSGAGGGVSGQVALAVQAGDGATVTLRADPEQVPPSGTTTLTWSAPGAEACTATGAWSGSKPASGATAISALTETSSFGLSCTGTSGNALGSVKVEVLDRTLRWSAPTQNIDGSPVANLGGYVVHWGTSSRAYTDSHTIEDGAVTEWTVPLDPGAYYFALTAFDDLGNESEYSNEVLKNIL